MQIVGINFDEKQLFCARIQNIDKPEFTKLKQFSADKKGIANMEKWLDECCDNDRKNMTLAIHVNNPTGANLAYRLQTKGFVIAPLSATSIYRRMIEEKSKKNVSEIMAALAIDHRQHWQPLSQPCLVLKSALHEREEARVNCQKNEARNETYTEQTFDFLMQLTRNAANIHADRQKQAEDDVLKTIDGNTEFKRDFKLLMSIPNMNPIAASSLIFFYHAYPAEDADKFSSCLQLTQPSSISYSDYRAHDIHVVRNAMYAVVMQSFDDIPCFGELKRKLEQRGKPSKVILMAGMHKMARMVYAILHTQTPYHT